MFLERLPEFGDGSYGWKCVNCGDWIDWTVIDNRGKDLSRPLPAPRHAPAHIAV
jgi:hypothetical protein